MTQPWLAILAPAHSLAGALKDELSANHSSLSKFDSLPLSPTDEGHALTLLNRAIILFEAALIGPHQ
jgi:hypothetical protein